MGPDFGLGAGSTSGKQGPLRPRPSLLMRGMELAGLGLAAYGLGSYRFFHAAVGGLLILGSYALYRRKHGSFTSQSDWDSGADPDGGSD